MAGKRTFAFQGGRKCSYCFFFLLLWMGASDHPPSSTTTTPANDEINDLLILKIGGSSITDKSKYETLNREALDWLADTLVSSTTRQDIVIVHGAGSFGHFHAKRYGLSSVDHFLSAASHSDPAERKRAVQIGLPRTRLSVQRLHLEVLTAFHDRGLSNAVGISPFSSDAVLEASSSLSMLRSVSAGIDGGLVPVIHGDAVLLKDARGAGILGGDKLVELIAKHFADGNLTARNVRAVFVTDVDGVFTADPNVDADAELVELIEVDLNDENGDTARIQAGKSSHSHDVTGGLQAKLGAAINIAKRGVEVTIVKCGSTSAEQAIRGESNIQRGTVIRLKPHNEKCEE